MLPQAFEDLQPLATAGWCLGTETERVEKRHSSSAAELRTFYDLMVPRLESAIEHLNEFDLKDFPEPEQHLMNLLLSMAEVTFAVRISDHVQPGVVYSPKGTWRCTSDTGLTANALIPADLRTDIGDGACYNDTFIEVKHA